jgi:hypothetical protein
VGELQEMIGVCAILTQDAAVDPVKYFNRAFEHYGKLRGRQGRMLATRVMMTAAGYQAALGRCVFWFCQNSFTCTSIIVHHAVTSCQSDSRVSFTQVCCESAIMVAVAVCVCVCRPLAANHSLMRAHFDEETARAALLLEAAAYALMRCTPPCARKAAFHLVLAGLRYHAAKQKRLAVHCYMQVNTTAQTGACLAASACEVALDASTA